MEAGPSIEPVEPPGTVSLSLEQLAAIIKQAVSAATAGKQSEDSEEGSGPEETLDEELITTGPVSDVLASLIKRRLKSPVIGAGGGET